MRRMLHVPNGQVLDALCGSAQVGGEAHACFTCIDHTILKFLCGDALLDRQVSFGIPHVAEPARFPGRACLLCGSVPRRASSCIEHLVDQTAWRLLLHLSLRLVHV